ncbi:putative haloacid dehalogenase/epoxide hydrolase [Bradyrhizobium oligotrophicum S58]|uniref:Putative haloacid dehalogenase/epoxide hydrolase n=1 Tax=Bradyrhizobium oligotrophicum S58 TaxID=1245469 RepID=M4ZEH3_9BRAD|nr:HAD family phosphatase [Bradyrhizobium oligotrophicum]BAM92129.1 putative haloacid dehalogenase/epoxide hydrolase [Bradyrhizobium oligotrophicum S58]
MTRWHVEAVLIDMDGTLLDTEKVYLEASIAALNALGYRDGVVELCHAMIGIPGPDNEHTLRNHFGDNFPLVEVNRLFAEKTIEILQAGMPLKRGVIALLDAIEAAGLPKAIVTSSSRSTAAEHLRLARIDHRFDAILTRDDVTRAKPHPDLYLLAANRLQARAQACIAIEDSNPGVAAAHAAGAITLMVPDIVPPTAETRERCSAVLPDLNAVVDLLRRHQAFSMVRPIP